VTVGVTYRSVRIEASGFHGREPDDFRWDINQGKIDSWSTRLTLQPGKNWSGQYSYAWITSPEALFPIEDQERMTASAMYNRPFEDGNWASTFLWGRTRSLEDKSIFNSFLLESTVRFHSRNYAWTRIENAERSNELIIGENPLRLQRRTYRTRSGVYLRLRSRLRPDSASCFGHRRAIYDIWGSERTETNLRFTPFRRRSLSATAASFGNGEITVKLWKTVSLILSLIVVVAAAFGIALLRRGFSARGTPSAVEKLAAITARQLAVPSIYKGLHNPSLASAENLQAGMEHFSDHCATCHANDGGGDTLFGKGLYPKPPDIRTGETQNKSDGELYYTIENGIRLSGMPAFGEEHIAGGDTDTWKLVLFIRDLPSLTADELKQMEQLNPKTEADRAEEQQEEEFLKGGEPSQNPAAETHHH